MYPTASLSISELLSGPYLLNIPIFQRPYSWGRDQAEQLLDDLLEASGIAFGGEADRDYFLGAVVLMDAPGIATSRLSPKMTQREFGVIDGQQRLVTLMTMLAILRDLEADPRTQAARRVQGMLTAQQGSRFRRTERFRLHLAGRERTVFEENVLRPGSSMRPPDVALLSLPEATLIDVRDRFRSALAEMPASARKALTDFVADRCYVVVIVGTDIDRSHQMFVVLNERGKKLQRNDILKSDILSRMTSADAGWAGRTWDDIGAALGEDFESFFGHLRAIFGYSRLPIVTGVRRIIRDAGGAETFFKDVFLPCASAYALIRSNGDGILPGEMSRMLRYLNRLPDADWAPAAILALVRWKRDPARAAFLLAETERLAMLTRFLCAGSGKRARRFAEFIKVMRADAVIDETHPVLQMSRDELRSIAFHLRDLHKRNPKVCRLLLMRLSDEMGDVALSADPDLYTIEHVLPQRPSGTSVWRQAVPSAELRSELVDCLGNLVLITQAENDRARNASWPEKKEIYGTTASAKTPLLAITRDVLAEHDWRGPEIEDREQRLLGLIEKIWRIDIKSQRPASRTAPQPQRQRKPLPPAA